MAKNKQIQLDELKQQILDDKVCPDLALSATQLVFGEGSPDAELVFIGEAPGKKEDQQGIPFIGAAGKFLNEMLETIHLKREEVYITNIVKYRPPNNRDPLPEEKSAFLPFLQQQLAIIKPKLVITLGRHSMESLLPGHKISDVHGEPQHFAAKLDKATGFSGGRNELTLVALPLFHPAAALYNGGLRQTLFDDFAKIPHILEKL